MAVKMEHLVWLIVAICGLIGLASIADRYVKKEKIGYNYTISREHTW